MIVEVWEKYLHSHYHGNLVSECVSGEDFFSLGFEYLLLILFDEFQIIRTRTWMALFNVVILPV